MKLYFAKSFNNILDSVIIEAQKRGLITDNPHDADAFVTWQDVRGELKRVADRFKAVGKKVFVVQHGRGATRDYDQPNHFPLVADYIYVWGEAEKRRLDKLGLGGRTYISGSPLVSRLAPKTPHMEKRVLFVPIIMEKEEPENLMVFAKLKEWESKQLYKNAKEKFSNLKRAWATQMIDVNPKYENEVRSGRKKATEVPHDIRIIPTIPYAAIYEKGCLTVACIPGIHDAEKYQAQLLTTNQGDTAHIDRIIACLRETDLVVCLEEGTLPLLAHALNIPVIHIDAYKYTTYGGVKYDTVELIQTPATYYTRDIENLPKLVTEVLNTKETEFKVRSRIAVVEDELGPQLGNAAINILDHIETQFNAPKEKEYARVIHS